MNTTNYSCMLTDDQNDISPSETGGSMEDRPPSNEPALSTSESPNARPTEVLSPCIPTMLQRDGALSSRVKTMRNEAIWSPAEKEQLDQIANGSSVFDRRSRFPNSRIDPRERFVEILKDGDAGLDPVLRYVVAHHEGCEDLTGQFFQAALESYSEHPHLYRRSFDELLPEDFRRQADKDAFSAGTNSTALDDWQTFEELLDADRERIAVSGLAGFPTGLPELDEALWGLNGLVFLGGSKGVGKTTLALSCAVSTLTSRRSAAVVMFSLDLSRQRIYKRLLCQEAGVSWRCLHAKTRDVSDEGKIEMARQTLRQRILPRLRVVERDFKNGIDSSVVRDHICQIQKSTEANELLIIIDLFQKWDVPEGTSENRQDVYRLDAIDEIRKECRRVGCTVAFLVLSEVRKDPGIELNYDDMKGDGRMSSDADTVLLMWSTQKSLLSQNETVPVTLRIAKGRDGVQRIDLPIQFHHTVYRFSSAPPGEKSRKRKQSQRRVQSTIDPLAE